MYDRKVVFISGPVTGVDKYWEAFEQAEDDLTALGYIPLSPSRLPDGMSEAAYMRICLAMIDSADAVLFLPGAEGSKGSRVEWAYCGKVGKPTVHLRVRDSISGQLNPGAVVYEWLRYDLEEVLGE